MKRNIPFYMLLISIAITSIGAIAKIMKEKSTSEVLLWIGMIMFFLSLGWIIYRLDEKK